MSDVEAWSAPDAAEWIAVPLPGDDKYSRGVLGIATGSERYPGAAVLGVEAALRTGVGMVRYLGPPRATDLVLQRRPEAVGSRGRVQAWLIGSGMEADERDDALLEDLLAEPVPVVLDGGALELHDRAAGPVVITPHYRELARLLGVAVAEVAAAPREWADRASADLGVTVLLKGSVTAISGAGRRVSVSGAPPWLATAGAGDALGGVLGALVATHAAQVAEGAESLVPLAATAAFLHGDAAARASGGGPLTILDLCAALPAGVRDLVSRR